MSYTKKTWQSGDTVTSSALNNMETGIDNAANPFIVTLTPTAQDFSGTMDKTPAEIYEAYSAGKRIRAKILGVYGVANTYLYADAIYYGSYEGDLPNVEVHFMFSFHYGETNLLVDVCTNNGDENYTTNISLLTPMS